MTQSRRMSLIEAKTNAICGLLVSFLFTLYGLPLFDVEPTVGASVGIAVSYFLLSFARNYILRRLFNWRTT